MGGHRLLRLVVTTAFVFPLFGLPTLHAAPRAACEEDSFLQLGSGRAQDAAPTFYLVRLGDDEGLVFYEETNGRDGLQTGRACLDFDRLVL